MTLQDPRIEARPVYRLLGFLIALLVVGGTVAMGQQATVTEKAPTSVVVGKATLTWHLSSAKPSADTAALIERYRQLNEAHFTGEKLPPGEALKLEPSVESQQIHRLPADLMHTMFLDASSGHYCTDSSTPRPPEAAAADIDRRGEDR